jgi:hypothetical protein
MNDIKIRAPPSANTTQCAASIRIGRESARRPAALIVIDTIDGARITWAFNEWASPAGPVEQEMIRKNVVSASDIETFTKSNILFRDQIWTKAAAYLIREHKPNLLLVHLLSLDSTHHQYGPGTLAATAAIAFLDSCVSHVTEAIRAAGMAERATVIVVSDHGFKKFTKQVRPTVALAAAGLAKGVYVLAEGGSAYVYFDPKQSAQLSPQVVKALEGIEGIDKIIGPAGFGALGSPQPDREPQMYHLLLTAKDGYSFSGAAGGPVTSEVLQQAGSHGYLAADPEMDAIFIASGYGVRPGTRLGKIANIDVAPTIARLLGVPLPMAKEHQFRCSEQARRQHRFALTAYAEPVEASPRCYFETTVYAKPPRLTRKQHQPKAALMKLVGRSEGRSRRNVAKMLNLPWLPKGRPQPLGANVFHSGNPSLTAPFNEFYPKRSGPTIPSLRTILPPAHFR